MDNELEYGLAELHQAEILYTYLVALKENSNGTPVGRKWAIAVTDCEKLMAWIAYVMVSK